MTKTKVAILACIFIIFLQCSTALASKGVVVFSEKSHYVVFTNLGYSVMEWYGGLEPFEDNVVAGNLEQFGFQNIYNLTMDNEFKVYIDDWGMSKQQAVEWLRKKGF